MKGRANKIFSANNVYMSPKAGYFVLSYCQDKINQTRLSKEGKNKRFFIQPLPFCSPPSILYNKKLIELWKRWNPASQITRNCSTSAFFIRRQNCLLVTAPVSPFRALLRAAWLSMADWQGQAEPYCFAIAFHSSCRHSAVWLLWVAVCTGCVFDFRSFSWWNNMQLHRWGFQWVEVTKLRH